MRGFFVFSIFILTSLFIHDSKSNTNQFTLERQIIHDFFVKCHILFAIFLINRLIFRKYNLFT